MGRGDRNRIYAQGLEWSRGPRRADNGHARRPSRRPGVAALQPEAAPIAPLLGQREERRAHESTVIRCVQRRSRRVLRPGDTKRKKYSRQGALLRYNAKLLSL